MTEKTKSYTTVSFTLQLDDQQYIHDLALEMGQVHKRIVSRSSALRHIIAVYRRLPEDIRKTAIAADDVS